MGRKALLTLMLSAAAMAGFAQSEDDYNQFRQQMLNGYSAYRGQVLDDYAKFLDTVWKDYESFRGESRFPDKKPEVTPSAPKVDDTPLSVIPTPDKPDEPAPRPSTPVKIVPSAPSPRPDDVSFRLYSATVKAPKLSVPGLDGVSEKNISRLWARFQSANIYSKVSAALQQIRLACHLNDWLTFIMVRNYSDAVYPGDENSSLVLTHYIMLNMGYNVRIGLNSHDRVLLLLPFEQSVFERAFVKIDGRKYYIFFGDTGRVTSTAIGAVYTCDLPQEAGQGKAFNLVLDNPQFPPAGYKEFTRSCGSMTLKGQIPETALMIGKDYLQTDIPVYASSSLSAEFRKDILSQAAAQIQGLPEKDAVAKILDFIQHAFKYQTDYGQFGYEKAFFVEEDFFYPANDCEDRAILLAFLVRNLLHLDVHLLYYPGHEATAIRFTDQTISGDGYVYKDGSKYLICDPTYIGAGIGQCMPEYENVKPKIELW